MRWSSIKCKKNSIYGMSAGKRDQIENFFKKKFLSKIDVDLIIWSRIFVISKKNFLSIWSLFPALTPYLLILSKHMYTGWLTIILDIHIILFFYLYSFSYLWVAIHHTIVIK